MEYKLLYCDPCPGHEADDRDRAATHLFVAHEDLVDTVLADVVRGGQLALPLGREWAGDVIEVHIREPEAPYVDRRRLTVTRKLARG